DGGYWMPLFVQLVDDVEVTPELEQRIKDTLRTQASARHVPDEIIQVSAIPLTHSGKRIEVPLKQLFAGRDAANAINEDVIANPEALAEFMELAEQQTPSV